MCEQSRQTMLWPAAELSTPSSAGSPARTSASPAAVAASKTARAPVSGESLQGLPGICGHGGSSPKMCLLCVIAARIGSSATWRLSATPSGRSWWVLTILVDRTDASGCFSAVTWPTPTASSADKGTLTPEAATRELHRSVSRNGSPSYLACAVLGRSPLWPTPTQDCATERSNRYAQGGLPLTTAVRTWPTPCAHEARLGYQHRHPAAKGTQISLTTEVMDTEGLAPQRGQPDQDSRSIRGRSRARLNPRWVAQLMGFPADFLDGVTVP